MAQYVDPTHVDYRLGGDKLRHLAQDYITTMEYVFRALNELKSNSTGVTDPSSGQFMVSDGIFYIRNDDNDAWVPMMTVTPYGGLKSDTFGKLQSGPLAEMPETGHDYDTYWTTDNNGVFRWLDGEWKLILTKNIEDMDGFDDVLTHDDIAEDSNDPGKLVKSNSYGELDYNITGSPGKLAGKPIFAPVVRDNYVFVYDEEHGRWVVKKRDDIVWDDVTATGEPGKIVQTDAEGKIHADITGSAPIIAGITLDIGDIEDGQVLGFDFRTGTIIPLDKDHFTDDDVSVIVTAGKLIKGNAQNKVDGSITGTAEGLHDIPLDTTGLADGTVIRYHASDNSFHVEPVGAVGDAASFILTANGVEKVNYNGSSPVMVDMSDILGPDFFEILRYYSRFKTVERNLDDIIYYMAAQNMYPDFNALTYGIFGEQGSDIDEFSTRVTSAIAGDDSIDVESIDGIVPGAIYYITDGNVIEEVQVKAYAKNSGVLRIIAEDALANTYNLDATYLYRSTADITPGQASAGSVQRTRTWNSAITWQGVNANTPMDISLPTTMGNLSDFTIDGDITFNASGMITLNA